MTDPGTRVGTLRRGHVADVPFFDLAAMDRVIDGTGLPLDARVSRDRLLVQMNSLVHTAVDMQLREPVSTGELSRLRSLLIEYVETAKRLRHSAYPPMMLDYQWYRQAVARLDLYERECSGNTKTGPDARDVLKFQIVPQAMGLYDAAFAKRPVSTLPVLGEEITEAKRILEEAKRRGKSSSEIGKKALKLARLKARGSTVNFIRGILMETYLEIDRRRQLDLIERPKLDVFNVGMRSAGTISGWILDAQNFKPGSLDLQAAAEATKQGFFIDQTAWWEASRSYQALIRTY